MGSVFMSLIIPVYNVEPWLCECLDSVTLQDCDDYEVICVIDPCVDRSEVILREYESRTDRIRVICNPDVGGLGRARNIGLSNANGEYVWFVDGDDALSKDAIQTIYSILKDDAVDILCFDTELFGEKDVYGTDVYLNKLNYLVRKKDYSEYSNGRELLCRMVENDDFSSTVWMNLFRRSFLERNHMNFEEDILHEDIAYTPLCYLLSESVKYVHIPLYRYRVRLDSLSTDTYLEKELYSQSHVWFRFMELIDKFRSDDEVVEVLSKMVDGNEWVARGLSFKLNASGNKLQPIKDIFTKHLYRGMGVGNYEKQEFDYDTYERGFWCRIEEADAVVVYGTGFHGGKLLTAIEKRQLAARISAFLCTARNESYFWFNGYPVYEIEEFSRQHWPNNVLIIIATDVRHHEEIENICGQYGYNNILRLDRRLWECLYE